MSNLSKEQKNILQIIDYSTSEYKKYTTEKYKQKFNWKQYDKYYSDLHVINLDNAWDHWVKYGFNEKRVFFLNSNSNSNINSNSNSNSNEKIKPCLKPTVQFNNVNNKDTQAKKISYQIIANKTPTEMINLKIRLLRKNNLIHKNIYENYGLHYYGWKEIINYFIKNFDKNTNFKQQFFFDEWLEKFLVWGDKNEMNFYLKEIYTNSYKIITFAHNPPFQKWYDNDYRKSIKQKIIFNEEHTNINLVNKIEEYELEDKIVFLYTLSNYHKEYLYNNFSNLTNKVVSIHHPIEITGNEKTFDYSLFSSNKQIVHIGWWLRNFKIFIDFKQPKEFHKTILIKNDFENEWNNLSKSYKLDSITIVKELSNSEYEKLFVNSCLFAHLEDACATNTILECIKFNTPILVNKLPSVVEYLGESYPLYYQSKEELQLFNNPNHLLNMVQKANEYLTHMDKSHVQLKTFNDKIHYDLQKLDINDENKLTWFCFIDDLTDIDAKIIQLYNNFVSQHDNLKLLLHIIVCESLNAHEKYNSFLENIKKYSEIVLNIKHSIISLNKQYKEFLNNCCDICETDYLVIIDIDDCYEKKYSSFCINYLNDNPTCDLVFTSYSITDNLKYNESFVFKKDMMLFNTNFNSINIPESGFIWRKGITKLTGKFVSLTQKKNLFREFWLRIIKQNFNIKCCNDEILYKKIVK